MNELLKLLVDGLVLRDSAQKGTFSWRVMLVGFGAVILAFAIGIGAVSYVDKHPSPASDNLLLAVLLIAVLVLLVALIWGWRYQKRLAARRSAETQSTSNSHSI